MFRVACKAFILTKLIPEPQSIFKYLFTYKSSFLVTNNWDNELIKRKLILAHSFKSFSRYSVIPVVIAVSWIWICSDAWLEGVTKQNDHLVGGNCKRKRTGSRIHRLIGSHAFHDLKTLINNAILGTKPLINDFRRSSRWKLEARYLVGQGL